MLFSVVVKFLNEELYIERCAKSLLDQDFDKREYEIIFVDNGSTDKSAEIVSRFPEITLLYAPGLGRDAALNKALEIARGDIVAFTDADCAADRDWLSNIEAGMKRGGPAIVFGKCAFARHDLGLRMFEDYENAKIDYVLSRCPPKYFFGCGRNMAIRSAVFRKFGKFSNPPFLEDTELVQRCLSRDPALGVSYLNNMRITHLEITSARMWLEKIKSYGEHSRHASIPAYTPLTYALKLRIYRYCINVNNYGLFKSIAFFAFLICGDFYYNRGRLRNFITSR